MLPFSSCMDKNNQRKRVLLVGGGLFLTLVMLLLTILGTIISTTSSAKPYSHPLHIISRTGADPAVTASSVVSAACKNTLYPDACLTALASVAGDEGPAKTPKELFGVSVEFAMSRAHSARSLAYNLSFPIHDPAAYPPTGAYDCVELLDNTVQLLSDVMDTSKGPSHDDVATWLSAALTNQGTCSESLALRPPTKKEVMAGQCDSLTQFISNSLALHKTLRGRHHRGGGLLAGGGRKLLSDGFPKWMSPGDRKLLSASPEEITPHAVVAQDGSGTHKSINEALAFVSLQGVGGGRTVIYVKAGTYNEYIRVPTKQRNVMLMGDGKGRSVIVGNRNNNDGWTTYNSATVAGMGPGFIAKDLTIINNSGPSKEQAVALRIGADQSVIYRCSIEGYQDTLYTHSNRQFYRENDIYGTVDFIFGNSAAVFQACNISPRRPGSGQRNSITAQGRRDPNQNTGISIQGCRIAATSDLAGVKGSVSTYLGRPWHQYSRVVIMQSYIDDSVHPSGWEPWSGSFALSTLYYGEYGNTGPGASTGGRVGWPGVHRALSAAEAAKFTVAQFIYGNSWIPGTGVSYNAGL